MRQMKNISRFWPEYSPLYTNSIIILSSLEDGEIGVEGVITLPETERLSGCVLCANGDSAEEGTNGVCMKGIFSIYFKR